MFRGAALGVVFLGCLYVAGFLYKVGFFGAITMDVSWLRMVEVDYLYAGVYAIFVSSGMAGFHIMMLVIVYAAFLTYADKMFYLSLRTIGYMFSARWKKEIGKGATFMLVGVVYYVATFIVFGAAGEVSSNVLSLGEKEGLEFLNSDRSDRLCNHVEQECYDGKLLYTNNSSYIFFADDPSGVITDGKIKITEQRHSDVDIGWHEKSVKRYRNSEK